MGRAIDPEVVQRVAADPLVGATANAPTARVSRELALPRTIVATLAALSDGDALRPPTACTLVTCGPAAAPGPAATLTCS